MALVGNQALERNQLEEQPVVTEPGLLLVARCSFPKCVLYESSFVYVSIAGSSREAAAAFNPVQYNYPCQYM